MKFLFGDIVKEIKEKVDRSNNPYQYYVAGDHMDTDELHLSRRGRFDESDVGPAFIHIFKPGQVLYGSRRTYLRKVAVADFEGVTANTTFVLESKDTNTLLQELLPFIMQTDRFVEHSIQRSKGSTNPYVLFKDLADFELELPNIKRQRKLAELLWAIDDTMVSYKKLISSMDELVKARFVEMFGTYPENEKGWAIGIIKDVVSDVRYGSSRPAVEGGKYSYLRMNNITYEGDLDLSDIKRIDVPEKELEKCTVRRGDVLFNRTNSKELVGKTCVYNRDEQMVLAGFVIRVRVNDKVLPEFLSAFLNTDFSKKMLLGMCKAAIGQANINAQEMQSIGLYIPPISLQREFVDFKGQVDKSKFVHRSAHPENHCKNAFQALFFYIWQHKQNTLNVGTSLNQH